MRNACRKEGDHHQNITGDRHFELTLDEGSAPSVTRPVDGYTYSVQVQVYTKEQLDLFDDWSTEYLAYNRKRIMDPTNLVFITENPAAARTDRSHVRN